MSTTQLADGCGAPRDRYTRVAVGLHWAIALFIIFNLATGFFMEGWPPPLRMLALMLHASSGMTVLVLTVVRVAWRLLNEPPPYPADMKPLERHAAHFAHFFLYAAMVLMPLTGWAILSAHAPPGSAGAIAEFSAPPALPPGMKPEMKPGMQPGMQPGGPPPGAMGARPKGPPPPLKLWNVVTMPKISAIEEIAREPAGVAPQRALHDKFVDWHGVGGWLLVALLVLHVLGALKHQIIDKHAEFERMSFRRRKPG